MLKYFIADEIIKIMIFFLENRKIFLKFRLIAYFKLHFLFQKQSIYALNLKIEYLSIISFDQQQLAGMVVFTL